MRKPSHPKSPTKLPGEKHNMQNLQTTRTLLVHVQSTYAGKKKTTPTKHLKPTIKISKHLHTPPRKQPNQESTSYKRQHQPNGDTKLWGESDEPDDVDAEAALYIQKLTEDWANVNLIRPTTFHTEKKSVINNEGTGEFWVATTTKNKRIVWLADTGSPRTFMNKETANELLLHISKAKIVPYKEQEKFKCFNNKQIKIEGVLHLDLKSGSWNAPDCQILLVENKTNNIMGRDILRKLGIFLTASKNTGKKVLQISDTSLESNIIK